jgi:2-iminobutanoate/2-iminopropanoate deaminase
VALSAWWCAPAPAQDPPPIAKLPFSPARKAGGFLFVSGQLPRTPQGADVRDSVAAETRQVMENLGRILAGNGYTFDDVVSTNVYLKDIQDYQVMNRIYASYFQTAYPARATVGGVDLAFGFRVEVGCVAYKEEKE